MTPSAQLFHNFFLFVADFVLKDHLIYISMAPQVDVLERDSVAALGEMNHISMENLTDEQDMAGRLLLAPSWSFSDISVRDLTTRLYTNRKSVRYYTWYTTIALVALLDFLAKVVADYIREDEVEEELEASSFFSRRRQSRFKEELLVDSDPWLVEFIKFLDVYSIPISVLFSLLWFTDAFVKATSKRDIKLDELDKKHLLDNKVDKEEVKEVKGAWGAYYRTVMVNCLLMPISFFIIAHHLMSPPYSVSEILLDDDEQIQFQFKDEDGHVDEVHSFSIRLSHGIFFVIGQYIGTVFVRFTGMHFRAQWKLGVRWIVKRTAFFAIRNPRQFSRKCRRVLKGLRWLKYLAPLIGASNKLKGNFLDLLQKFRQRHQAAQMERARRLLWKNRLAHLPQEELEIEAAIMVQRNFRRQQADKAVRALQLVVGDRVQCAAQRMQHVFRRKLASARAKIMSKRHELQELQKQKKTLNTEERRRLYELQDELSVKAAQLLNKKMLLRPNTRFAVTWKVLFVVCVAFEMSQLAFAPTLKKYVDEDSGQQLDIGKVLEIHLIPTPTSQWQACGAKLVKRGPKVAKTGPPVIRWLKEIRRKAQGEIQRTTQEEITQTKGDKTLPTPWYCNEPFSTAQSAYIRVLRFVISEFLVVVGIVCFLDVFVTFFTGELDPGNGSLVPKPFFSRWLLPGIILQLLVNPQMETVSKYVGYALQYANHVGPIRVYRWTAAFFYPLFSVLLHFFIHAIWRPFVKKNNQNPLLEDPFATRNPADRRTNMLQMRDQKNTRKCRS